MLSRFTVPACLALALGASCGGERVRTAEVRDLLPHAAPGTAATTAQRGLMSEAKSHRLVLGQLGEELVFSRVGLPADTRLVGQVKPLDAATPVRLNAHVAVVSSGAVEERRIVLRPAERGEWLDLELQLDAAGPIDELRVRFDAPKLPRGRVAFLRPVAHFEVERELTTGSPRQAFLITTDTLRADALGCYGNDEVATPALDALAAEGLVFERAFSTTNVTNPSHTSMLTSLYLEDHGVDDNFTEMGPDVPTMLEPLRAAGLRTAAFVSSFNFQPERSDLHRRFDEFFPAIGHFERRAEDVNLDALPWLGEHEADELFVWLHYFDVHMPYAPPPPYDRMYDRSDETRIELPIDYQGNPKWFSASRKLGHYKALYFGEVTYLDAQLGELFRRLRDLGMWERATIVVVSDHGEALGEHGVYCEHSSLHDEVTRVPLLLKPPLGADVSGAETGALVSTVDLYPTFFELLDLPVPGDLRGRSLLAGEGRDEVYSTFARRAQVSVRTRDHRFLLGFADEDLFPGFSLRVGERELFRGGVGAAPVEVTGEEGERADELARRLDAHLEDVMSFEAVPISAESAAEMEKLGYTQR